MKHFQGIWTRKYQKPQKERFNWLGWGIVTAIIISFEVWILILR